MTLGGRVIAMALDGVRPPAIAYEMEMPVSSVYSIISKARKDGVPIPHFSTGKLDDPALPRQELRFNLDPDSAAILHAEANRRGLSPSRLARNLLAVICEDHMFGAILEES